MKPIHASFAIGERVLLKNMSNSKLNNKVGTISSILDSDSSFYTYQISLDKPLVSGKGKHYPGSSWFSIKANGMCLEHYHGSN